VVLERVRVHLGLPKVGLLEVVHVHDQDPARFEIRQVHLQRGRVHRNQGVDGIARRVDLAAPEVDLEPGDTGQRPRGGADLGGVVGEGREVVSEQGGGVGELVARDLHAVSGVSGKPDDGGLENLPRARGGVGGGGHRPFLKRRGPARALGLGVLFRGV
jgi:hypothetical protein